MFVRSKQYENSIVHNETLRSNIVLKDVTVTGKLKVLSFGVNSARYNNLIVRGKRSYSH